MSRQARVLVVEDDPSIREAVAEAVREEGHAVTAVADGHAALDAAASSPPDAAVVDVRLPAGPDGREVTSILHERWNVPVVMLTAASDLDDRLAGFSAGADDYLTKPFGMPELIARLRVALRRAGVIDGATNRALPNSLTIDIEGHIVRDDADTIDLTRTEFGLLVHLAERRGRVITKTELLNAVWGDEVYDDNVVEVHLSNLRRKLGPRHRDLISTVRGVGYRIDR